MSQALRDKQAARKLERFRWKAAKEFTSAILSTNEVGIALAAKDGVNCANALIKELRKNPV